MTKKTFETDNIKKQNINKTLLLLPTLNEVETIQKLYNEIKKLNLDIDFLFIDDGSADGTINIINDLITKNPENHFFINRKYRKGIGSAHLDGLDWAYSQNYNFLISMDTDYAHNPIYLKTIEKFKQEYDLVVGSRFIKGGGCPGWPVSRKFLSYSSHFMTFILFRHSFDSTNSFRCYNLFKINKNFLSMCNFHHYEFFFTSMAVINKKKYNIYQFPMQIEGRVKGNSKMYLKYIFRSIFFVFYFFMKLNFFKSKN